MPTTIYQPLDATKRQIRLLRMRPYRDAAGDVIECETRAFSLDDDPVSTAVSYCWTKEPPTRMINLNGESFAVRPNLHNYLDQRWREEDAPDWIFVDAICINQADMAEKTMQVLLMGDVYRNAASVVA